MDGMLVDLNDLIPVDSGWVLVEAKAINDRGQIVGQGHLKSDEKKKMRAFLLTPAP
jgi:hypothetical protein